MTLLRFSPLSQRLEALEGAIDVQGETEFLIDDAEDLVEELLSQATAVEDFAELSRRLKARKEIDLTAVKAAVTLLRKLPWGGGTVSVTSTLNVDPQELLSQLDADIATLEEGLKAKPSASFDIFLDFTIGSRLMRLVLGAIGRGLPLDALTSCALEKINLLDAKQVVLLWALVQREFDPTKDVRLEAIGNILPERFLRFTNDSETRQKLAAYICELKPRLMLAMQGRGHSGYPLDVPQLARVLTWRSTAAGDRPSLQDTRLAKAVQRIIWFSTQLFGRTEEEFVALLNVDSSSPLTQGLGQTSTGQKPNLRMLSYELRKTINLLEARSLSDSDVAIQLRRYKLGLEVMAPEITKEIEKKSELQLQKHLAKFLIEAGIFVVGTKLGRSETDLVSWEGPRLHVLEVKIFKGASIAPSAIERALAQLSSYLDQHPTTPYGILVIYNLTPVQVSAPGAWLRDRFLVVGLNLQERSPSGRTDMLQILEGQSGQLIEVLRIGASGTARRRRRAAGSTA